ncbi:MAG: class I SAM-dependent methyltransferase [Actinomycetota bacterium]|nr:class I SAM-dependent methyltransferase [Actinomycetota bacterium]
MQYDESRAARYDESHRAQFAEAETVVAALAQLHAEATERDGGPGAVLELGVGTGRLAIPLAARGIDVWGIDDSEPMVARLAEKPGGAAVRVVVGDFAEVADLVPGPFSLVFVAFNTLFELLNQDAQVRCLQGAARRLTAGGFFVVEALAPDITRLEQTVSTMAVRADGAVLQATRHDPLRQRVAGADVAVAADGTVSLTQWDIRYVSVPELDLMARLAGLRLRERWGGWHRQPFTASSSTHVSVYEREQA